MSEHRLRRAASRTLGFFRRHKHNYRVGVARASANGFLVGLTSQYNAIFATTLGANSVQLGALSSIGSAISAGLSIPIGWLVDRRGVRLVSILALVLSAGGVLLYGVAQDWRPLMVAAMLSAIATRLTGTGSSAICADSVKNEDRVTARMLCGTLSAIAAMSSPLIAAYLVTSLGGIAVQSIRPLYFVQLVGYGLVLVLIVWQLHEPRRSQLEQQTGKANLIADIREMLAGRPVLWKWIAVSALTTLPMPMF